MDVLGDDPDKTDTPWTDPRTLYTSASHAAGIMERVIRDFDLDADLGDGGWLLDRMLEEPPGNRVCLAERLLRGTGKRIVP